MENLSNNSLFDTAASFVLHTKRHIFLTGRAGTGKTTFLKSIKEQTSKNTVVVAPTGVAAINAGGVTMHSFFQLPIGSFIPEKQRGFSLSSQGTDLQTLLSNMRINKEKRKLFEELELLVIDEVSMLRADLLDAIDGILRHFRKNQAVPFGGVQVLYIGDMYQLPPVVSNEEWTIMSQYYKSMFFFDALVMQEARPLNIELDKIYRQTDEKFIELLNNVRNNTVTEDDLRLLNKHYDPSFYPEQDDGYIILTSHNFKADKINQSALAKLQAETNVFEGELNGDFNEKNLPVDKSLALKVGAQIMFIKNDKGENRRYYNGKIGIINRIKNGEIYVRFPGDREELLVEQEVWRNIKYNYNEAADKIEEEELGSYKQYPIRLAWAVTIHKSQGLTFEKAIIDAGQSFAAGQVYVALSRLTSLSGLVLSSEINASAILTEQRISAISQNQLPYTLLQQELKNAQEEYLAEKLLKSFNWDPIALAFQEHHKGYNTTKLQHQAEAVNWSMEMLNAVMKDKDVSDRFANQLKQLFSASGTNNFMHLSERVKAANDYFSKEIDENLIANWQKHYEQTKLKSRVKKYLKSLHHLYALLLRKKQEINQAAILASGLADGKNMTHLLQHYQNTSKTIPTQVQSTALKVTEKEDSKTISLHLLQQGKDIEDIAKERGLARSTIEGHLMQFIVSGEVKLNQLVSKENEGFIRKAIALSKEKNAGAIRAALGETFTYNEIKAVFLQMEREEMM